MKKLTLAIIVIIILYFAYYCFGELYLLDNNELDLRIYYPVTLESKIKRQYNEYGNGKIISYKIIDVDYSKCSRINKNDVIEFYCVDWEKYYITKDKITLEQLLGTKEGIAGKFEAILLQKPIKSGNKWKTRTYIINKDATQKMRNEYRDVIKSEYISNIIKVDYKLKINETVYNNCIVVEESYRPFDRSFMKLEEPLYFIKSYYCKDFGRMKYEIYNNNHKLDYEWYVIEIQK